MFIFVGKNSTKEDNENETSEEDIESNIRSAWMNKDLAMWHNKMVTTCVRFTTLPGACQIATLKESSADSEEKPYFGPHDDICDIKLGADGKGMTITCENCKLNGNEANIIGQTVSDDKLDGSEMAIENSSAASIWKAVNGKCDDIFVEAEKAESLKK